LYWPGETVPNPGTVAPGKASCIRNTYAMNAPIKAIAIPVNMYWKPMVLWSVE
jgi:hypothetical protein